MGLSLRIYVNLRNFLNWELSTRRSSYICTCNRDRLTSSTRPFDMTTSSCHFGSTRLDGVPIFDWEIEGRQLCCATHPSLPTSSTASANLVPPLNPECLTCYLKSHPPSHGFPGGERGNGGLEGPPPTPHVTDWLRERSACCLLLFSQDALISIPYSLADLSIWPSFQFTHRIHTQDSCVTLLFVLVIYATHYLYNTT